MSTEEECHHPLELNHRDKEDSSSFPAFFEEFMDGCFSIKTIELDEHAEDLLFAPISPTNHVEISSVTNLQEAISSPTSSLRSFRSYNSSSNEVEIEDSNTETLPQFQLDNMMNITSRKQQQVSSNSSSGSDSETVSSSTSPSQRTVTIKEAKEIYDLQCHICSLSYKNPKVLPCLHSFCHACLENTIKLDFKIFLFYVFKQLCY